MRKIFIPLLAAIALPKSVNANVAPEVHNLCKDVSDYVGCVKSNTKNKKSIADDFKRSSFGSFGKFNSILNDAQKEVFSHEEKTYKASVVCPEGQNMYWVITGLLRKNVSEMGCMTSEQFKMAKMDMEIKGLKRAIRTNSLNDASNTITNMIQQQQINTNQYNSNFSY